MASEAWWPRLHSFAVGLEGSPDLAAARKVADHLGHHAPRDPLHRAGGARRPAGRHLSPRDLRRHHHPRLHAHVPDGPLHQGDGHQDGALGRRLRRAVRRLPLLPQGAGRREFHEENVRKLASLHLYDCLRANKSMAAWGVEARVPFLDKEFMDVAMRLSPPTRCAATARSRSTSCAKPSRSCCPTSVACGARRSSSPTAWVLLDRQPRGGRRQRRGAGGCGVPVPAQPAADQGGVAVPQLVRGALPRGGGRADGAGRAERRVQHTCGDRLGRGVRGVGGSERASGGGRAQRGLSRAALAYLVG
jgi:hypothetical protein